MKRSEIELRVKAIAEQVHARIRNSHARPFILGLALGLLLGMCQGITLYMLRLIGIVLLIAAVVIFLMWLVGDEEAEEGISEKESQASNEDDNTSAKSC